MAEWIRYLKKWIMLILLFPLRIFPVKKNRVFLNNDLAQKYSGNPKAVADFLRSRYPGSFQIVYSVSSDSQFPPLKEKGLLPVKHNSVQYFFYAMTAQVFLTNSGGFSYLPLKKKQCVINTWHGGGPFKKIGTQMYGNTRLFRADLKLSAKKTTYFLSSNTRFTENVSKDMLIPRALFWEIGSPRNDQLIHIDEERRKAIRYKLGLAENEKLILYAPTYRKAQDNYFKDSIAINYGIDADRVCLALEKKFGGKWLFGFRFHPRVTNREMIPQKCVNLSDYEDMQELLIAADAMINDFSSSMWDFMLTGKPCFTFAVDLQHYIQTTDVYSPVNEWPFSQATNNDELEKNILEFDQERYTENCKRFYSLVGGCETGRATELVCSKIYDICFCNLKRGEEKS